MTARGGARARAAVVAVLERRGRFLTAEPFFARGRRINVDKPKPGQQAAPGDLVLVAPNGPRAGHGRVVKRLGRPDVARDVLEGADDRPRAAAALRPARRARGARGRGAGAGRDVPRKDLRDLPTFTIDPPTARDFDDAISAERLESGAVRVWVHIADVAAHVPPGSAVDREAYRRATSVYVPGKVEPMLPEALSNDACSLVPHQDRLAVTAELELDGAKLVRSAFHRSVIRSDARLDYPRVDRVFAGAERAEAPWAAPLEAARAAAAALDAARAARGALAVESVEPEFDFSHEGHVTGLAGSEQTESHRLIEHLMIAANEAVAALLEARKLPGALPRARAARAGARRAPGRAARRARRADAAAARDDDAAAGRRRRRRDLAARRLPRAAHRARPRGAHVARAALAQAGALLRPQRRPPRPAVAALLPLHVADPALPGPDLPPRAAVRRSAPARTRRPRARSTRRPSGAPRASATPRRSSAPPTTSRARSCSSPSCSSAAGRPSGRAR